MNVIKAWYTYPTETYSVVELVNVEMFYYLYNSLKQTKVQVSIFEGQTIHQILAKWKKLEPNEIDFSQGFSQKVVSRSFSVFYSLPASGNFCHLIITFANS